MDTQRSIKELEIIYGPPYVAFLRKVSNRITPKYCQWVDASVIFTLANIGSDGVGVRP